MGYLSRDAPGLFRARSALGRLSALTAPESHTLDVPGATLTYDVRGDLGDRGARLREVLDGVV